MPFYRIALLNHSLTGQKMRESYSKLLQKKSAEDNNSINSTQTYTFSDGSRAESHMSSFFTPLNE